MKPVWWQPTSDPKYFEIHIQELRKQLQPSDPFLLASHTGARFEQSTAGEGFFRLRVLQNSYRLSFPDFVARLEETGEQAPLNLQALLLYYFHTSDGAPLSGRWISFSELPDGRFYNQAFQGYTGKEVSRLFQNDLAAFEQRASQEGGEPFRASQSPGDVAYRFQALPNTPLLLAYWLGDEDFPASCQVLFDASAPHYLPTDAYAILGSMLTHRLVHSKASPPSLKDQ